MLGRYAFTLPDVVARGELCPLRDPASASDAPDSPDAGRLFSAGFVQKGRATSKAGASGWSLRRAGCA